MALSDAAKLGLIFVLTGTIVVGGAGLKVMYDRWSKTASELKTAKEALKHKDEVIRMLDEGNAPSQQSCETYFRLGEQISKMLLNTQEAYDKVYRDDFCSAARDDMSAILRDFTPELSDLIVGILNLHVREGNYGMAFSQNPNDPNCPIEELERCRAVGFYYDENGNYVNGELPGVDELVGEYREYINRNFAIIRKNKDFADKVNRFIEFLQTPAVRVMVYDEDFAQDHRELFESLGKAYAEVREEFDADSIFKGLGDVCTQLRDDQDAGSYACDIEQNLYQMEQLYRDLEQQQ